MHRNVVAYLGYTSEIGTELGEFGIVSWSDIAPVFVNDFEFVTSSTSGRSNKANREFL